jgi:protein-tyrosine kinase
MSDEMPIETETMSDETISAGMAASGEGGNTNTFPFQENSGTIRPGKSEGLGISPVYLKSRAVQLDPDILEENRCVASLGDASEIEQFRLIRTQILQRAEGKGGVTVMVTSALPGEGKTLIAVNLALTFAKEYNQTALLVDCDLRQQGVHTALGFPSDKGLVDYLLYDCPITDLMVWPGIEKLTVISGGRTLAGSSELLGSPRMRDLVADMKERYPERYVFFDVPSVLTSADPLAFAPLVDYIVVVVQAGKTAVPNIVKAIKMLPQEKIVGLVLNRQGGS